MSSFKEKIVLVTGSYLNTGLKIAVGFMDEGLQVIITGSSSEKLKKGTSTRRERGYSDFTHSLAVHDSLGRGSSALCVKHAVQIMCNLMSLTLAG